MPSAMNMADKVLYMGLKPGGTRAERHSAARSTAAAASRGTIRISDKENTISVKDQVQEALMEEARASKGKGKPNKNELCTGPSYEYCDVVALTDTHVAYKQGADFYGRTYMRDVGTGEVELGPKMTVHQELVFGAPDDDDEDADTADEDAD